MIIAFAFAFAPSGLVGWTTHTYKHTYTLVFWQCSPARGGRPLCVHANIPSSRLHDCLHPFGRSDRRCDAYPGLSSLPRTHTHTHIRSHSFGRVHARTTYLTTPLRNLWSRPICFMLASRRIASHRISPHFPHGECQKSMHILKQSGVSRAHRSGCLQTASAAAAAARIARHLRKHFVRRQIVQNARSAPVRRGHTHMRACAWTYVCTYKYIYITTIILRSRARRTECGLASDIYLIAYRIGASICPGRARGNLRPHIKILFHAVLADCFVGTFYAAHAPSML